MEVNYTIKTQFWSVWLDLTMAAMDYFRSLTVESHYEFENSCQ